MTQASSLCVVFGQQWFSPSALHGFLPLVSWFSGVPALEMALYPSFPDTAVFCFPAGSLDHNDVFLFLALLVYFIFSNKRLDKKSPNM